MKKFKKVIRRSSAMKGPHPKQRTMAPPSPPDENQQNIDLNFPIAHTNRLSLSSQDISDIERPLFEKYWDELDPFATGKVNLPYVATFLRSCHLSDHDIQQIIALFEHQPVWEQHHIYALLRLVSHIKHGRDLNADLIYLPAPSVPVMTEFPINFPYPSDTNHHHPRFRSFSDPFILAAEEPFENPNTNMSAHLQRRSVDDASTRRTRKKGQLIPSSLLLMQAFIPASSPSSNNNPYSSGPTSLEQHPTIHVNLRSNRAHIPPPPVPSQKTKPSLLTHSNAAASIINSKNIFDTPPNYYHCDPQQPIIQPNRISHSHRDKKHHHPAR